MKENMTRLALAVVAGLLLFGVAPASIAVTATIFALAVVSIYGGEPLAFGHELLDRVTSVSETAREVLNYIETEVKNLTGTKY